MMDAINTSELIRRMPWSEAHAAELEMLLAREWLVTNGLGGYAAGTVSGILTRRYHGLLVAGLPAPFGRMMLLPHLSEQLRLSDGTIVRLGGEERAGEAFQLYGAPYFSEFRLEFCALQPAEALLAERERRQRLLDTAHTEARTGLGAELLLAADQFVIRPTGRVRDAVRAHAAGDQVRTVIAGYHWFTDWGRDTMISLEGLTLTTGRHDEAGYILRTFADYVHDGLIPNLFPEGEQEGLYHTADATLWFFHALDRYVDVTGDQTTLRLVLPKLLDIVEHHLCGTHFGIRVDPQDGLLCQGQEGYQLTWMDAKVGDWVVTPRRGKAVEINALWYNALRLLESWVRTEQDEPTAQRLAEHAALAYQSFNDRFWYAAGGYLYDVVDGEQGDDPACRPNQVLAISLRHTVLAPARWQSVLKVVQQRLLTPVGLRSLAPDHPEYKARYDGDLRARDGAYHQGTVWAWLIGPFIDAWIKVYPDDYAGARRFLHGFEAHLSEACIGSISEIFDAEEPFTPRGCVAQAWSVAEVLRCWVKTSPQAAQKPADPA